MIPCSLARSFEFAPLLRPPRNGAPNGDSVHRFRRRAAGQSSVLRSFPKLITTVAWPMTVLRLPAYARPRFHFLQIAGFEQFAQPALAENLMFESFQCQCIYVEVSNDSHPHSGSVEYRAKSCAVCQARAALMRADTNAIVAFDQYAPRYQRMH